MAERESLIRFRMATADERVEKLRQMAADEERRNAQWRIESVLRYDADLIESLANDLHAAHQALGKIALKQPETLAMIESNGFVFDSIGREPGNWQHLAFSIYTDLCEVDLIARSTLAEAEGDEE